MYTFPEEMLSLSLSHTHTERIWRKFIQNNKTMKDAQYIAHRAMGARHRAQIRGAQVRGVRQLQGRQWLGESSSFDDHHRVTAGTERAWCRCCLIFWQITVTVCTHARRANGTVHSTGRDHRHARECQRRWRCARR